MTKPITCVAAMILHEEGRLLLTDPVSRYLPELKDLKVYVSGQGDAMKTEAQQREITIQDLMRHTAGFTYDFNPGPVPKLYHAKGILPGIDWMPCPEGVAPIESLQDMVERLAKVPLVRQAGEKYEYSVSIDVLGRVVEILSGLPLDAFFQKRIFGPLGMKDTGFYVPPEKAGRLAANYAVGENAKLVTVDVPAHSRHLKKPVLVTGGAGLVSSAGDYMRFTEMLRNGGELDGVRILSPRTIDLMTLNHLPGRADIEEIPGYGYGLGFYVAEDIAKSGLVGSVGEFGWGGAASTDFWADPEEELSVVFMTQLLPWGKYPLWPQFKTLVYQALVD